MPIPRQRSITSALRVTAEAVCSVALATGLIALLEGVADVAALGVIYLLAVLFVAIRRGQVAALGTAVLAVLALNFFFIEPRHTLTVAHSENAVALVVLGIVALVVGRLAGAERQRAAEAERRERQARMIAGAASSVLGGHDMDAQLDGIAASVQATTGQQVRLGLTHAPAPDADEIAVPLDLKHGGGWLYARAAAGWQEAELGEVAVALGSLIDVALERKKVGERIAEAEAVRRADVAKTAVLHAISHDLRSPLTAIRAAAGGLSGEAVDATDRAELLSVIDAESIRLSRLVDDLLDLSKIEAGAVDPSPGWCDLGDVVISAAAQAQGTHDGHPVEIDLPAELPLIEADPSHLERVFSNLIDNAIRFSPPDAPVSISGGVGAGRATVRVTDRGRGIPESKRAEVFEPFFRARDSDKGAGLGLAICKGFVEANGGRILLQSASGGTSFAVSFPLQREPVGAT